MLKNIKAQSLMEYTIVIGIIITVMFAMSAQIKRGTQGMIKVVADQIGNQKNADQKFVEEDGFMREAHLTTKAQTEQTTRDKDGRVTYYFNDRTETETYTASSLGFMEEQ